MDTDHENTYIKMHKKMDNINMKIDIINVLLIRVEQEMRSKSEIEQLTKVTIFR